MIFKRAIILAAGVGSRLRPLTNDTPKCLVSLAGQSFLERALVSLSKSGLQEFHIVTGYRHNQIEEFVKCHFAHLNIHFLHNHDFPSTNTGFSLWLALKKNPQPFVLLDGDVLFDLQILIKVLESRHQNLLAVDTDKNKLNDEAIKVVIDPLSRSVTEIGKQIDLPLAAGEYIGLSKWSMDWARLLDEEMNKQFKGKTQDNHYYEDIIAGRLQGSPAIHIQPTRNLLWSEVDTLEDYRQINQQLTP